ncbi:MAG TPA: hypothetical protein VIK78_05685 [Ruminiclostridium sp.]
MKKSIVIYRNAIDGLIFSIQSFIAGYFAIVVRFNAKIADLFVQ